MPCHPDRVRRNYHTIVLHEHDNAVDDRIEAAISISRCEVASWMSAHEAKYAIRRAIERSLDEAYKGLNGHRRS